MTFEAFREHDGKISEIKERKPFTVMLNPDNLTFSASIEYNHKQDTEYTAYSVYKTQSAPTINIPTIHFDTTGVIPKTEWPQGCTTVKQMVTNLKKVIYDFDGKSHQPPVVQLTWGKNTYTVRVTKFNVKYTLFDVTGEPVRAEVSIGARYFYFEWKLAEKSSPDLTHLVEVKAGDTLPLMCDRVYNDSSYYLQIARINGLTNFRNLKPGTMLEFPPIRD